MGDVVRRVLQNKSIVLGDHYRANPIIVARLSEQCNNILVVFENVIRLLFRLVVNLTLRALNMYIFYSYKKLYHNLKYLIGTIYLIFHI